MTKKDILENIRLLANSQGFYSQMYVRLSDGSKEADKALEYLEQQHFKDVVDMILFLEQ